MPVRERNRSKWNGWNWRMEETKDERKGNKEGGMEE